MDQAERNKLRTLANDAIIDLFGSEGREAQLAQALERAVEQLDYHGDCIGPRTEADEVDPLDRDALQAIHTQLEERLIDLEKVSNTAEEMVDDFKEALKDLRRDIKEIGDEL